MTSCIKTGAYVYLDNYGAWTPADIFILDPLYVVLHLNPEEHWSFEPLRPTTHHVYWPQADVKYYWASDKRTLVIPMEYLKDARHV